MRIDESTWTLWGTEAQAHVVFIDGEGRTRRVPAKQAAAAPELLEALETVRSTVRYLRARCGSLESAEDLLEKIESTAAGAAAKATKGGERD